MLEIAIKSLFLAALMIERFNKLFFDKQELLGIRLLKLAWLLGLCISLLSLIAVGVDSILLGNSPTSITSNSFNCPLQAVEREKDLEKVTTSIRQIEDRMDVFREALDSKFSQYFVNAHSYLAEENKILQSLKNKEKGLEITPMSGKFVLIFIAFMLPFFLSLVITQWLLKDFDWLSKDRELPPSRLSKVFWSLSIIFWLIIVVTAIFTSIVTVEGKTWYDSSSFCVSEFAFIVIHIALLGSTMSLATPVSVAFVAANKRYIPPIKLQNPDGRCGVGDYIDALKRWTFWGSILVLGIAISWTDFVISQQGGISRAYLIVPFSMAALLLLLMYCFLRNAYTIRKEYILHRTALGATWAEVSSHEIPQDPTVEFISHEWWKLPTVVYPVLGTIFFVAEFFGISKIVIEAFK